MVNEHIAQNQGLDSSFDLTRITLITHTCVCVQVLHKYTHLQYALLLARRKGIHQTPDALQFILVVIANL